VITTFYSYKGGVGRTSLAIETAARLAVGGDERAPLRVALWDLDLEAPGVHHFPEVHKLSCQARAGTLDLLDLLWTDGGTTADAVSIGEIDEILRKAVVTDHSIAGGRLGVLAPNAGGALDRQRLIDLDLPKLFATMGYAPSLLRVAAERLRESLGFDVVIIDARTGVSDLAATATMGLPDTLVFVLRMDEQDLANVDSILTVIRAARAHGPGESPFHVLSVATFVPDPGDNVELYERLRARRRELVTKVISPTTTRSRLTVEIPLRLASLIDENVPSLEKNPLPPATLAAYESLAAELFDIARPPADVADPSDRERTRPGGWTAGRATAREQGTGFIDLVGELLRLDGWITLPATEVEFDLRIERAGTFGKPDAAVVLCRQIRGRFDLPRMQAFEERLRALRAREPRLRGLVVAERGFTVEARAHAEVGDIDIATASDLLNRLAPLDAVRLAARREWENTDLESRYVPLAAVPIDPATASKHADTARIMLDSRVMAWLGRSGSGLLAILGDFGSGKSTFVRRLAHVLAVDETRDLPVALHVDLRTARSRALSADGLLDVALASAGVPDARHAAWRYRLTHTRSVVLIVDGFDEMLGYTDPPAMHGLIRELLELAQTTRVIITSRTNYFISHRDAVRQLAGAPADTEAVPTELLTELTRHPATEVLEILPFDRQQVYDYLERQFVGRGETIAGLLEKQQPLADIARRPYLLKLVAETVEQWQEEGWPSEVNLTELYDLYVEAWQRDRSDGRVSLLVNERLGLAMNLIASEAWSTGGSSLSSAQLSAIVTARLIPELGLARNQQLAERMEHELRTATFLSRDSSEDHYAFPHSSFLEFFVARGVASALRRDDETQFAATLDTRRFTPEIGTFLLGWTDIGELLPAACRRILQNPYRSRVSENALYLVIQHGRQTGAEPVSATGACLEGANLTGADLAQVDLSEADLRTARLDSASMQGAILVGAHLDGARLNDASLFQVDARRASLKGVSGRGVRASAANLTGADLRSAALDGIDLRRANLHGAQLQNSSLAGAALDEAVLSDVALNGADLRAATIRADLPREIPNDVRTMGARLGWPSAELIGRETVEFRGGHRDWIRDVTTIELSDGIRLVSAGDDETVRIWDPTQARQTRLLADHVGWVKAIDTMVSQTGEPLIISATEFGKLAVWYAETGQLHRSWDTWDGATETIAVFRRGDRTLLATGGDDGILRIWDPETGEPMGESPGHAGPIIDLCRIDEEPFTGLVTAGADGTVRVWDGMTGEQLVVGAGHETAVSCVAAHEGIIASGSDDRTIRIWDRSSGHPLMTLATEAPVAAVGLVHFDDGLQLLSTTLHGNIEVRTLDEMPSALLVLRGHTGAVESLATFMTDDGPLLASGSRDWTLRLWDPTTGQALQVMRGASSRLTDVHIVHGPAGPLVCATARIGGLPVWDAASGQHVLTQSHGGGLRGVALENGPSGPLLASSEAPDHSITLWNPATGEVLRKLVGHTDWVHRVRPFFDNGRPRAISASEDGTVRTWDPLTGKELAVYAEHDDWVRDVAAVQMPDGPLLVSVADDEAVRIWDQGNPVPRHVLHEHDGVILSVAVLDDGGPRPLIATAGMDTVIRVWDPAEGRLVQTLVGHEDCIRSLVSYRHGNSWMLASGSDDHTLRIWNMSTLGDPVVLKSDRGSVHTLAAVTNAEGPLLASCTDDGVVQLRDLTSLEVRFLFAANQGSGEDVVTLRPGVPLADPDPASPTVRGRPATIDATVVAGPYDGREIRQALPDAVSLER
jgi:WD40 repeat protein/MinD-like ATPase involved in chromosome partitioning or flagellar assembly